MKKVNHKRDNLLCDSVFMNVQNRQIFIERRLISGLIRLGEYLRGRWEVTTNKYRFLGGVFRANENVLMTIAVVVACFFEYTKNH